MIRKGVKIGCHDGSVCCLNRVSPGRFFFSVPVSAMIPVVVDAVRLRTQSTSTKCWRQFFTASMKVRISRGISGSRDPPRRSSLESRTEFLVWGLRGVCMFFIGVSLRTLFTMASSLCSLHSLMLLCAALLHLADACQVLIVQTSRLEEGAQMRFRLADLDLVCVCAVCALTHVSVVWQVSRGVCH